MKTLRSHSLITGLSFKTGILLFCALVLSLHSSGILAQPHVSARYNVSINRLLDTIDVGACYEQGVPRDLAADEALQRRLSGPFFADGQQIRPRFRGEHLRLPAATRCFRYQVSLNLNQRRAGFGHSYRVGTDVVTKPQHWLIQPQYAIPDADILLRFDLPEGINASVPWPEVKSRQNATETRYRLAVTDANWDAQVAFGYFDILPIPVNNTMLRMAVLDSRPRVDLTATRRWMREAALSTLSVHGQFPQPSPQAMVVPVGPSREAVPFARVLRGGGVALQFYIDPYRPFHEFSEDWTATHEFSHLLLPYVNRRDAWLSEGLASYLQNVLRVRDGRITERTAWSKLYAGFQRGIRATRRERSPRYESRSRSGWSTMRIYWGGAAIWFLADVELRRRSHGQQNIDTALARIHECCMAPGRIWRARDLMRELDRVTANTVFSELYNQYANSNRFPDIEPTLKAIGVDTRRQRVRLNNSADEVEIRQQIMTSNMTTLHH